MGNLPTNSHIRGRVILSPSAVIHYHSSSARVVALRSSTHLCQTFGWLGLVQITTVVVNFSVLSTPPHPPALPFSRPPLPWCCPSHFGGGDFIEMSHLELRLKKSGLFRSRCWKFKGLDSALMGTWRRLVGMQEYTWQEASHQQAKASQAGWGPAGFGLFVCLLCFFLSQSSYGANQGLQTNISGTRCHWPQNLPCGPTP